MFDEIHSVCGFCCFFAGVRGEGNAYPGVPPAFISLTTGRQGDDFITDLRREPYRQNMQKIAGVRNYVSSYADQLETKILLHLQFLSHRLSLSPENR